MIPVLIWARKTKFVFKLVKWQILVVECSKMRKMWVSKAYILHYTTFRDQTL